jgi:hypothetical protein
MATTTFDTGQGFNYEAIGFSGPLVNLHSTRFVVALVKLMIWAFVASAIPVGLVTIGLWSMNWLNYMPFANNGVLYQGLPLAAFVALVLLGAALASIVAAIGLVCSFLGMLAAFEDEPITVGEGES